MKTRVSWTSLVVAGLLGVPAVAPASVNLLTNGSFETGGFSGWTVSGTGTSPGNGPLVISGATPYGDTIPSDPFTFGPEAGGNHQAYFVDDNASEKLTQTVTVTAGQLYEVGFDLFPTTSGAANANFYSLTGSLGAQNVTTVDSLTRVIPVAAWTHFSGTYTPMVSGPVSFSFLFTSGPTAAKDVLVDEVYAVAGTVTPTPEPALFGLLGAGLLGVGMVRRKR